MSLVPSRMILTIAACAGFAVSFGASPMQPAGGGGGQPQPVGGAKVAPEDPNKAGQPDRAAFRQRMRERYARVLSEMRDDQAKLEEAIKKLDAGASFDEVRDLLPERLAMRFRAGADAPPDMEGGPRRERFGQGGPGGPGGGGPGRADQPFSAEDWEAVNAIIKHAQPDMLAKFDELRQKDAEQAQKKMLEAYPRLRPLLELYKHDRAAFDLRLEELVILRTSLPLAKEVIDLKKAGKADDSDEVKAARAKLHDLGKRHFENRLALQRHELEMSRQRLQNREKDIADQAANPDRSIDRSIDGLIMQAERGGFDRPGPERRGGPPDGARRRGNDKD